jgi:hypothetical protein
MWNRRHGCQGSDAKIEFCHRSKKYRTKYFSALKELFATAKEGEANEIKEDGEVPTERYEQIKLAAWLDKLGVLYTASANGELRDKRTGALLKSMGVKAGHPDIVIYASRKGYHTLLIELKRVEGGVLRPIQKWWADRLNESGFLCVRANGFLEAKKIVLDYLGDLGFVIRCF